MTAADSRPVSPREPLPEDCCGGGCANCVYIRYGVALERYREALREWQLRHPDCGNSSSSQDNQ
ncbi:MAG TPA: oxidoreductase-like domain-containing protein [Burkholderiales bacterium]|nr:oxidoreductase-like domain-containing protein [Burkholderiales bacterium]